MAGGTGRFSTVPMDAGGAVGTPAAPSDLVAHQRALANTTESTAATRTGQRKTVRMIFSLCNH